MMTAIRSERARSFTALTLAAAGIAAGVWLASAQESTRMTNAAARAADQTQPVTASAATASANAASTSDATTSSPAPANTPGAGGVSASGASTANATPRDAAKQSTAQQPATPSAVSSAGQRAFLDPATGELRQPEHDELAAIATAAAAAAPAKRLARTAGVAAAQESFGPDGSIEAVVPEDLHTFTVATRGADGRITIEHAQGAKGAVKVMKANSAKGAQAKEDRNDR